jgi:two-component system, sensor histidine kinase and response regulator
VKRAEEDVVLQATYRRSDRHMFGLLGLHMATAIWFGSFYDTWFVTWTVGGLALGMFAVAWLLQPGTFLTRCLAGVALQAFVALHIYQLHGLAEMHFFFFTAFAGMLVYQDWRCMWPGALLIIAQHILFAVLHNQGAQIFFFEDDYVSFQKLAFHFGIAIFHVVLCNFGAHLLRQQTLNDARIRAELQTLQQAAEKASNAKTTFLGDMSHELRTPMTGVLSATELMLQDPHLSAEHRDSLEIVRTSALALVDIVNDALDLARVEAGRLELTDEAFDLRRLAEEVVELLSPRATEHGIELVARWQPGGPNRLRGDAGRWRQVLVNLAGNALKFTPGGHVLIDVAVVPTADGRRAVVTARIDDSGKGIPTDVLPKLFQRFEQGGAATFSNHGGSGLGLAISRQLVARMGGELTVHSVPGAGSTFVVRVELAIEAAAMPPLPLVQRVLLTGSHEVTLAVVAEQLEEMGADVQVVGDAAAAQRTITAAASSARPFRLLLAEAEVLRELAELPAGLRVIALGAGANAAGPWERCPWPGRHQELRNAVSSAVRTTTAARTSRADLGLRVLLVEDDAICAKVATRMLQLFGCAVVHAEDGVAALAAMNGTPFDVVLMDCRMPRMDGYEATRRIRAGEGSGAHVPIVALSANSLPADRDQCLQAGADAFLGKPVQLQALHDALAAVAARLTTATT